MKAIILSAGQGSRLGHMTDDRPKCLIEFNGRSLLDRQLDTLDANGVKEAIVVTGFHDEFVNAAIERRRAAGQGPGVRTVFNPFYKVADNLGSLFLVCNELEGDCLVWNGDTLVSKALMAKVVGNSGRDGVCVTVDRKDSYDEDDMKVVRDAESGRLRAIGKRIAEGVNAESIGLLAFRASGPPSNVRCGPPKARLSGTCASFTTWRRKATSGRWTSAARNGARSISPKTSNAPRRWSGAGTRRGKRRRLNKAACRARLGSW
jgi:choline kinase